MPCQRPWGASCWTPQGWLGWWILGGAGYPELEHKYLIDKRRKIWIYGLKANGEAKVVNRKNVQLSFLECETYHSNGIFTISRYIHCTSFLLEQFSFQPVLLPWHPKESNFQTGLSLEALPLLWKAERCGLHGQHWIVDALRALAAEDLGFLCFFCGFVTGSGSLWV